MNWSDHLSGLKIMKVRFRIALGVTLTVVIACLSFSCAEDELSGVIRVSTGVLSYDSVLVGESSLRTLTIENIGDDDLTVIGIHIDSRSTEFSIAEMAAPYDVLNEKDAEFYEKQYRSISMHTPELPRAVDAELAFYGASFMAWPRKPND